MRLHQHHVLIHPSFPWEELRIGGGTPPLLASLGWLLIYHGVAGHSAARPTERHRVRYTAGVLVVDEHDSPLSHRATSYPRRGTLILV
jgi:beta-1,2-mannobiose phosphorylase / 1,2-beta-oligomannan phosphorylase